MECVPYNGRGFGLMPYKYATDKKHLPRDKDRRIKLTDEQREDIRANPHGMSKRGLARHFNISRRLIDFIQNPEKVEANKQLRKERGGWKQYYNKEEHRETIKEHRQYKQKIIRSLNNDKNT